MEDVVPAHVFKSIEHSFHEKKSEFFDNHFICYFQSKTGSENVIYFEGAKKLT